MFTHLFKLISKNKTDLKINAKITGKNRQLHKLVIGEVGTGRATHYIIPHYEMIKDK
jgi:hypothetical protein